MDDLIVGFRRKGEEENGTNTRNLYVPFYPRWQQPSSKEKGLRVEFLIVVAVVGLVLAFVVVGSIYNWSRKRCCKAKSRDFNFSMSMYDDDSDPGVVLRQSTESEENTLTRKPSLQDQTSSVKTDGNKMCCCGVKGEPHHKNMFLLNMNRN